jgi:hypothetical protein
MHGTGIGTEMLEAFVRRESPDLLATYTRNPAIIRMIGRVAQTLYPLDRSPTLQARAMEMPGATLGSDAVYHFDRYGPNGLYLHSDPAKCSVNDELPLSEQYSELRNPNNALVIAAQTKKGI